MTAASPNAAAPSRWDAIDVARGTAIAAMVVYHVFWDLNFFQLSPVKVVGDPAWNWFARAIAASFLALAGVGLWLAHGRAIRPAAFLRRLARVAGAALAVTLATLLAFPESYIFFGILHAIAVCSVLALPFLRAPLWLVVAAAAACLAAPRLLTSPVFDQPLLDWLGLGSREPMTNDYVPVFPWFGAVLVGVAAGRALTRRGSPALARWRAHRPIARALAWAGRRSLPIYLVHQPVLLAALGAVLLIAGPSRQAQTQAFVAQCAAQCLQSNPDPALCRAACACVADRLAEDGAQPRRPGADPAPDERTRISEAAQVCLRGARP